MSVRKCIFDSRQSENDEAEPELLSSPCLPIGTSVQFREIPSNGEEYLLSVIKERQKCAVVTKYDKDYSELAKNQTYFVQEFQRVQAPDKLKPTIEWQNIQIADFSEVRMYLSRLSANKSTWPTSVKKIEFEHNDPIEWKKFFAQSEPTLSCVFGLSYKLYDRGLEILTQFLKDVKPGNTIQHKTGQWIYAFLACTRQPLLSETTSILRDLARKCAEIRSRLNEEDDDAREAAAPLNLFICIVARYFRQYDLAD